MKNGTSIKNLKEIPLKNELNFQEFALEKSETVSPTPKNFGNIRTR